MSNSIVVKGNVTKDGVVRFTPAGDPVLSFQLADNQGFGDKKTTIYWSVQMWGKRGQSVADYCLKGAPLCVIGEASERPWTNKEGVEQRSLEIRANDIWLLGSKDKQEAPPKQSSSGGQRSQPQDNPFADDDPLPPF